jgi:hypothetical protein
MYQHSYDKHISPAAGAFVTPHSHRNYIPQDHPINSRSARSHSSCSSMNTGRRILGDGLIANGGNGGVQSHSSSGGPIHSNPMSQFMRPEISMFDMFEGLKFEGYEINEMLIRLNDFVEDFSNNSVLNFPY